MGTHTPLALYIDHHFDRLVGKQLQMAMGNANKYKDVIYTLGTEMNIAFLRV